MSSQRLSLTPSSWKPNSPLQGYTPPDSSDTEENVPSQIEGCMDLDTLQFFVISRSWISSSDVHLAVKSKYDKLDHMVLYKDNFACDDIWESSPADSTHLDQWEEVDSMGMAPEDQKDTDVEEVSWMLEEDYIQDGGMAEIFDGSDPELGDLYDMVPYKHQQN